MTATAAVSRAATVSLCDLIAREPERTATGQRIVLLWQRTLRQPADDCRYAIADLVNTGRLVRTGPSQWTANKPDERPAPPAPLPSAPPATSAETVQAGLVIYAVTLNAGDEPMGRVTVSGPREQVDAVVRDYLRRRVSGKVAPVGPMPEATWTRSLDLVSVTLRDSGVSVTGMECRVSEVLGSPAGQSKAKDVPPREIRVGKDTLTPRPKNEAKTLAMTRTMRRASLADKARQVYDAIARSPGTLDDLRGRKALAGMADNTLRGRVSELHAKGLIRRRDDGVWEAT